MMRLARLACVTLALAAAPSAQAQTLYACQTIEECKMSDGCVPVEFPFAVSVDGGNRTLTLSVDGADYPLQRATFRDGVTTFVGLGPEEGTVLLTLLPDGKVAMTLHEITDSGAVIPASVSAQCMVGG